MATCWPSQLCVGRRYRRRCRLEQSRLSKMAWLFMWRSLLDLRLEEAVLASCMFGSPHRKEFRLLGFLLDVGFLDVRCCGGHSHVRIQGSSTKPSEILPPTLMDLHCISPWLSGMPYVSRGLKRISSPSLRATRLFWRTMSCCAQSGLLFEPGFGNERAT